MKAPRLEIHVPISPNQLFFTRMHYLAASLQVYGGALGDSALIVTVGADEEPWDVAAASPWSRRYPVQFRWLDRGLYQRYLYWATRLQRFCWKPGAANVLFLDPDVLLTGPIDELADLIESSQSLCGLPAHVSPVRGAVTWEKLFERAGLGAVPYVCEHSGYGIMFHDSDHRLCPPYFNLGVLGCPAPLAERIAATLFDELAIVWVFEEFFRAQMSLTLSVCRNDIPWRLLPLRFHFPNDQGFADRFPADFADMRLVHYLRKHQMNKDDDFLTPARVEALYGRTDLEPVNKAFLERLRPVHERVVREWAPLARPAVEAGVSPFRAP